MTETVTMRRRAGNDRRGNPRPAGAAFDVAALEVAPGNTLLRFGIGTNMSSIEHTAYLPLSCERQLLDGDGVLIDDWDLTLRGKQYRGRPQVWKSGGRGVVAVLAQSIAGEEV